MSDEMLMRLCKSICEMGVRSVYISGGGEPLLHKGTPKAIDALHAGGIKIGLLTNGDLLTGLENANKLEYIQVSLHGWTREAFAKITKIDRFDRCLLAAQCIKDRFGDEAPVVGVHFILTEESIPHATSILRTIREHDFDYAKFRFVADFESRGLFVKDSTYQCFLQDLDDNQDLNDPAFTNLFSLRIINPEITQRCWSIDLHLLANIDSSGGVYLCVPDIGNRALCIGSVIDRPLEEVWGSDKHVEVAKVLQQRYTSGGCSNCRFIASNPSLGMIAELVPATLAHSEFV